MSIDEFLIGFCPGFSEVDYRRKGSRGPAVTLIFDPQRIDPLRWLTERWGEVQLKGPVRQPPAISFEQYLKTRRRTDTPEGDFVNDSVSDSKFPDAITWQQIEAHLRCRRAIPEAIRAGRNVWRQYLTFSRRPVAGPAANTC